MMKENDYNSWLGDKEKGVKRSIHRNEDYFGCEEALH